MTESEKLLLSHGEFLATTHHVSRTINKQSGRPTSGRWWQAYRDSHGQDQHGQLHDMTVQALIRRGSHHEWGCDTDGVSFVREYVFIDREEKEVS